MRFLLSFVVCIVLLSFVDAGCYKEGRRPAAIKKKLTEKELYSAATALPSPVKSIDELPKAHDWCNVNGKSYCSTSWNQHIPQYCGACWIHGALGQANDRIKIQLNALHDNNLARQVILNCGETRGYGAGCNGGEAFDIFEYMHRFGLPDETCQNYVAKESEKCDDAAICHNCMPIGEEIFPYHCWAVKPPVMYRVKEYGMLKGEAAMMSEILARGPITCGFVTTDDFDYNYRGGIYIDRSNSTDVNHDVEVVGWGEENGVKYWKARNSWGTYWGENGFFRILRGENNALFEDECVFAIFDTHEVEDVLEGSKKGSMYGIYSPDNLHILPTPVQIAEYGKNDPRVYDDVKKSSHSSPHQSNLIDATNLKEGGIDALSAAVKGGEKIGAQGSFQATNADKYIKSGEQNAAKFANGWKEMAKEMAQSGKDYAKMADKYSSMMQGNNMGKEHGGKGPKNDNDNNGGGDYMKWAGSYGKYANGQGGQGGGDGDAMKTGAKANVDEIKAAGKLSKQFIPNGNNYYKSPSTSALADENQLSAAIVNAFIQKGHDNDHDHDDAAEEARAKEREEAIRHAIEEAFKDEKADKKQTAEQIKSSIIAALNDIKAHAKEHGKNIGDTASTAAKEEANEIKEVANNAADRIKSLGKEISSEIEAAQEKSKQKAAAVEQKSQPQSLADSAAVADGVLTPSSSSSFPTVMGLLITAGVFVGLYYGFQKTRENSYQAL